MYVYQPVLLPRVLYCSYAFPCPKAHLYPSYVIDQYSVDAPDSKMDTTGMDDLDLVEALVHKFENTPPCFHLELPPGVSIPTHVLYWIVGYAAGWITWGTSLAAVTMTETGSGFVRRAECYFVLDFFAVA